MKIIKQGIKPSERIHNGQCNNCGTKVECKEHEAKYQSDWRDGGYYIVKCPTCGYMIYV